MMQVPVAIVADDLSGACDCGVEFLGHSTSVTVHIEGVGAHSADGGHAAQGIIVINTESRDMEPSAAASAVASACRSLRDSGAGVFLKKGDSAFRGNFVVELDAAIETLAPAITVLCPAIPDFGRTTIDGIQRIDGVPVDQGFYANDPKHPATTSRVSDLVDRLTGVTSARLPLGELRASPGRFQLPEGGANRVVIVDGETNGDLDLAARLFLPGVDGSLVQRGERVLFVGGQGIAAAIARHLPAGDLPRLPRPDGERASVLIVAGSLHPTTRLQLRTLEEQPGVAPVRFPPAASDLSEGELLSALVRSGDGGVAVIDTGPAVSWPPERIEAAAADLCASYLEQCRPRSLLVTGGSTAYAVCRRLGIRTVDLRERIATGAVAAIPNPEVVPLLCIKGGSLGEPDTMVRFVRPK